MNDATLMYLRLAMIFFAGAYVGWTFGRIR